MEPAPKLILPGPELTVEEQPKARAVMHRDWHRLRREAHEVLDPIPWFREGAWASLGIAVGAFIGWIGWGPVYDDLAPEAQLANNWQGPLLLVAALAFGLLALVLMLVHWSTKSERHRARDRLLKDMDEVWGDGETGPKA
jgi:sulfite exporter TauE/SafE